MKKRALIFLSFLLVISALFFYSIFYNPDILVRLTGNVVYTDKTCNGCIGGSYNQNCHPIGYIYSGTLKCVSDNLWQKIETTAQITNQTDSSVQLVINNNQSKVYNILAMGDSNTYGVGNPSGCASASCAIGYRMKLKEILTNKGIKTDFVGGVATGCSAMPDCQNEGWPGMGIAKIQSRVNSGIIEATQPDFVLLLIGSNDMWVGVNPPSLRTPITDAKANYWVSQLEILVDTILLKKPDTQIIIAKPATPSTALRPLGIYRTGISDIVSKKQALGLNVSSVDFINAHNDGVHYYVDGHETLALIWADEITRVINLDNPSSNKIINCTESDWNYTLDPLICPENNQQTQVWSKGTYSNCSGGFEPINQIINCNYSSEEISIASSDTNRSDFNLSIMGPICEEFNYSEWSNCTEGGIQTRVLISTKPENCSRGNISLTQNCTYNSKPKNLIIFTCAKLIAKSKSFLANSCSVNNCISKSVQGTAKVNSCKKYPALKKYYLSCSYYDIKETLPSENPSCALGYFFISNKTVN